MTKWIGYIAKRSVEKDAETGIDYRQLCCAILYNELFFLEYAAGHDNDEGRCRVCREQRPKWGTCEHCGTTSEYVDRLVEVTTFFESEFACNLCEWTGTDYKSYIDKSKELFMNLPPERIVTALLGAAEWWEKEGNNGMAKRLAQRSL